MAANLFFFMPIPLSIGLEIYIRETVINDLNVNDTYIIETVSSSLLLFHGLVDSQSLVGVLNDGIFQILFILWFTVVCEETKQGCVFFEHHIY